MSVREAVQRFGEGRRLLLRDVQQHLRAFAGIAAQQQATRGCAAASASAATTCAGSRTSRDASSVLLFGGAAPLGVLSFFSPTTSTSTSSSSSASDTPCSSSTPPSNSGGGGGGGGRGGCRNIVVDALAAQHSADDMTSLLAALSGLQDRLRAASAGMAKACDGLVSLLNEEESEEDDGCNMAKEKAWQLPPVDGGGVSNGIKSSQHRKKKSPYNRVDLLDALRCGVRVMSAAAQWVSDVSTALRRDAGRRMACSILIVLNGGGGGGATAGGQGGGSFSGGGGGGGGASSSGGGVSLAVAVGELAEMCSTLWDQWCAAMLTGVAVPLLM